MERKMAKEYKYTNVTIDTLEAGQMTPMRELGFINSQWEIFTMDSFLIIKSMGLVPLNLKTEVIMLVIGNLTVKMEKEFSTMLKLKASMMVTGLKTRNMDMEFSIILMGIITTAPGIGTKNVVKECFISRNKTLSMKESGRKIWLMDGEP